MLAQLLIRAAATAARGFTFSPVISADVSNYNVRTAAVAAGWNQTDALAATVTVNSGVVLSATSTAGFGFDTGGPFPVGSELKLVNSGFICGMGGAGGANDTPGSAGGAALRAQVPLSVTNSGTIAGGGGGGGGSTASGGGGGGGRSGRTYSAGGTATVPGAPGTFSSGGTGGNNPVGEGKGGTTGPGMRSYYGGSGGGGWGAEGGGAFPASGGAAGAAVSGNGNITWVTTGTRYGALT